MKSSVYKDNPRSFCELKKAIAYFIRNISDTELLQVFANKLKTVEACLKARKSHVQQLL